MLAQGKVPLPTGRKAKKQHGGGGGGDRLVASEVIRMPHDLLPVNFQPELVEAALDDTAPRAVPNLDSFFTNTTPCVAVQRAGAPPKVRITAATVTHPLVDFHTRTSVPRACLLILRPPIPLRCSYPQTLGSTVRMLGQCKRSSAELPSVTIHSPCSLSPTIPTHRVA
jgi:hypothetical protein